MAFQALFSDLCMHRPTQPSPRKLGHRSTENLSNLTEVTQLTEAAGIHARSNSKAYAGYHCAFLPLHRL